MVNWDGIKNERMLRTMIKKNLNREYWDSTTPSVQYIAKLLDDAYASGIGYDVSDMKNDIYAFAAGSTNQASNCIKLVGQMKFKSEEASLVDATEENPIVFYDIEVFKNLFIVCWKVQGEGKPVVKMINPTPTDIEKLTHFRLVGFNNRKYDDHLIYARLMGYDNEQLFELSQKIINEKQGFFREAYRLAYADVYDFSSKKMSLKKWEIELGISHIELGWPWDKEIPEELWEKAADYCVNDVVATEYVFNDREADYTARKVLSELTGLPVIDSTRMHVNHLIFGNERKPMLVYTDFTTGEQTEGR